MAEVIDTGGKPPICDACGSVKDKPKTVKRPSGKAYDYILCRRCENKKQNEQRERRKRRDPEAYRGYRQEQRQKYAQQIIDYGKKYREERSDEVRERLKRWRAANPVKVLAMNHNYRARRAMADGEWTDDQWQNILETYRFCCIDCGRSEHELGAPLTVGHAIPLIRGGSNWPHNLIPQCFSCNASQYSAIHDVALVEYESHKDAYDVEAERRRTALSRQVG